MRDEPSAELLALLARLVLAAPEEVRGIARRARRLANGLPLFDMVWVDALAQARILTAYQAAEINAGRGERLCIGPYVLRRPLTGSGYAEVFEAHERTSRREVRLIVARLAHGNRAAAAAQLEKLVAVAPHLADAGLIAVDAASFASGEPGTVPGDRMWAASPPAEGITANEWIVAHGRLPPLVVLEIARQMAADLAVLERFELVHGDLGTPGLILGRDGRSRLPHPGVRSIVRPEEGYGRVELPPEAYDTLAPERIIDGTPPTPQSELFACGCLWWHLLSGRAPLKGGDALSKLKSAQAARIGDIARLAPDVPPVLAAAVSRCLNIEPARRGDSLADLAARLGPSTREGRQTLSACARLRDRVSVQWGAVARPRVVSGFSKTILAGAAGCVVMALAILWPLWRDEQKLSAANEPSQRSGERVEERETVAKWPAAGVRRTAPAPVDAGEQIELLAPTTDEEPLQAGNSAVGEDVLLLPSDAPVNPADWTLRPGMVVRGIDGSRPQVHVGAAGILVTEPGVRFENVDFLWRGDATRGEGSAALVRLASGDVSFHGCSFRGTTEPPPAAENMQPKHRIGERTPVAVLCLGEEPRTSSARPEREVRFRGCHFNGLRAGVGLSGGAVLAIHADQTLLGDCQTFLMLKECPLLLEPISLELSNVTVRECGSVVECSYDRLADEPGRIAVVAKNCVFAPRQGMVFCRGAESPLRLLSMAVWSGEGSLVSDVAAVALWQTDESAPKNLDDAEISIDGLARSRVEFAGANPAIPAACRVTDWTAPLTGSQPPGADPEQVAK